MRVSFLCRVRILRLYNRQITRLRAAAAVSYCTLLQSAEGAVKWNRRDSVDLSRRVSSAALDSVRQPEISDQPPVSRFRRNIRRPDWTSAFAFATAAARSLTYSTFTPPRKSCCPSRSEEH